MASRPPMALVLAAFLLLVEWGSAAAAAAAAGEETCSGIVPMKERGTAMSVEDFGGVGDGRTLNTAAFEKAVAEIERRGVAGGTLYVPPGVWLTGVFNLTSHMTLFLARGAVIKATQDTSSWPLIDALPSYGRGRELPGGRYMSLIHGNGIHDVIITGENGTIDGQGEVWWNMWRQRTLPFTRPNILELMHSKDIIISNVVFQNSPFWNIHPVYCSNVVVRNVTVLAPYDSPNTDGIDPDSSLNVCIEDCYISTGDDLVAVKSGWDEYGMAYARPSSGITIRRLTGSSPFAGIAVGSETSGGVENVLVESIHIYNTGIGIHIKTNSGRGGYIRNITVSGVNLSNVRKALRIAGDVGDHPDDMYNPNALPIVNGLTIKDVWGVDIQQPGSIDGIKNSPFTGVCLSNVKLNGDGTREVPWKCADVSGGALGVQPSPCTELTSISGLSFCTNAI
ncbi:probable polygalacturonase isoform X1 [Elaeis guineensis]|uniref:Probable polygalacturonase n=1 Tax=Elaeis guineensis var. tenera TaxID=51953 RepID=A0A6I9QQV2_ELAGV|nr:probable polygalacturonase [Elaeis guineensis]XP_010913836.1 probable polygalacturonase [Elaeis guineensis]XP_010913839.1 probable polygalacturonase [Elaeis guineensis]